MNEVTVGGIGATVRVRLDGSRSGELSTEFRRVWSRCLVADQPGEVDVRADLFEPGQTRPSHGDDGRITDCEVGPLLQRATQAITAKLVAKQVGKLILLHAGAVSHPATGASLVFVAPGGTGKTTLSRLLGTKYGYLTDETVGITADGRILPYPKPLSIRDGSASHKRETSPDELELLPAPPNPWVRQIVLLRRSRLASGRASELSLINAIAALTPESSSLSKLDKGLHRLADLIDATSPVQRWTYSEAEQMVTTARSLLKDA